MRYHPPQFICIVCFISFLIEMFTTFCLRSSRVMTRSQMVRRTMCNLPHRMHLSCFHIALIDRWCMSSPKMYDMLWAKVERLFFGQIWIFKIWVFLANFLLEITLHALNIDKKSFFFYSRTTLKIGPPLHLLLCNICKCVVWTCPKQILL